MTKQRRFTKEFEDEAVRLVATSGRTPHETAATTRKCDLLTPAWKSGPSFDEVVPSAQRALSGRARCTSITRASASP